MKRFQNSDEDRTVLDDDPVTTKANKNKKREIEDEYLTGSPHLDDEDLLFEVLKHLDARSLAIAACVSKQWYGMAQDERLWELLCTRHWPNVGCGNQQLRSVVVALGGFRRLHSLYLRPLLKPSPPSPLSQVVVPSSGPAHWGKDEVNLSLSLLSIRYFEKMSFNKAGGRFGGSQL